VGVNVPTVFNVAFDYRFAWNGRFATLEEQLDFAMTSKAAMAGSWQTALKAVLADPSYVSAIATSYPERFDEASLRDALVEYTRSLITPNARFDRHLRGESTLVELELRGYQRFREYGCITCHQGINVGGNLYQRLGVMRDYFAERGGELTPADLGRFAVTGDERDRFVFRVPSLRNVALTAPYFHDGSTTTLEDAVHKMARYQLGRQLTSQEALEIAAFLRTLTGELAGRPL
jgi:cytochrome c peroxidase